MSTITPNQMKSEIEEHTKGAKTYEDMLDRFVNYIVNNYSLKKNRKPISVEEIKIIPKTFTAKVDISEELTEAIILEENGRQDESSSVVRKTLESYDEIKEYPTEYTKEEGDGLGNSVDDDFDEDFKFSEVKVKEFKNG